MMAISSRSKIGASFLLTAGLAEAVMLIRSTVSPEQTLADELKARAESLASAVAEQQRAVFEEERDNRIILQNLIETLGESEGLRCVKILDENAAGSALSRCWRHMNQARRSTRASQPASIGRKAAPIASMNWART